MDGNYANQYGPTKGERREKAEERRRQRMDAGKKIKLLNRLAMERAAKAQQALDARQAGAARD